MVSRDSGMSQTLKAKGRALRVVDSTSQMGGAVVHQPPESLENPILRDLGALVILTTREDLADGRRKLHFNESAVGNVYQRRIAVDSKLAEHCFGHVETRWRPRRSYWIGPGSNLALVQIRLRFRFSRTRDLALTRT